MKAKKIRRGNAALIPKSSPVDPRRFDKPGQCPPFRSAEESHQFLKTMVFFYRNYEQFDLDIFRDQRDREIDLRDDD